ncbi:DUF624 domain-containing protein [Alkalihalobacillus sp. LMS39]|uniref:YesL family protein n=1 Tax=Alkalihalobacillus sp. LMS39 TaxID=2924032 RepID=UPI001FB2273F|nr:DUF624 domain-containing protein [Alkalihalobacillus sp. LMS39]UOE93581.1 DUF624 domain-containing protein [Alkalihalobacillus sp. LMS39]
METSTGWSSKLLVVFSWFVRFTYINLLWILFSVLGGIIFGFMPATAAMFAVMRKWLLGEREKSLFPQFFSYYKKDFLKLNGLGLILLLIGSVLYVNFSFLITIDSVLSFILLIGIVILSFLYVVVVIHFFPIFVHFQMPLFQYLNMALTIGLFQPFRTLSYILTTFILIYLLLSFPGALPFLSGSILAFIVMSSSLTSFKKMEQKFESYNGNKSDSE